MYRDPFDVIEDSYNTDDYDNYDVFIIFSCLGGWGPVRARSRSKVAPGPGKY